MKLSKKAAIFAAALFSLGGAAYTYNQYGTQDNSMILENIEAMTRKFADGDDDGDSKKGGIGNQPVPCFAGDLQSENDTQKYGQFWVCGSEVPTYAYSEYVEKSKGAGNLACASGGVGYLIPGQYGELFGMCTRD